MRTHGGYEQLGLITLHYLYLSVCIFDEFQYYCEYENSAQEEIVLHVTHIPPEEN